MVEFQHVSFALGGVKCAGRLYLPDEQDEPLACVVLAHGFSGTMDRLYPHAEQFAAHGLAALVFDYRGFGASEGEPRQTVDLRRQQDDLRAAIAFARGRTEVAPDRILLWGNSLGGAHAISVAADDPRVTAVVAQIPFNGFPKKVEGRSAWDVLKLRVIIVCDVLRGRLGLSPYYIPMVGRPGQLAVTATDEAEQHIHTLTGKGSQTLWRNSVAPRGLMSMARYRPANDAVRLTAPLLVCIAADDHETPEETTRELAERAPRGELRRYPGTHFSFYTDPDTRHRVITDQVEFYRRILGARS